MNRIILMTVLIALPGLVAAQPCPTFTAAQQVGTVAAPALTETSGLVASRDNADVLWAHNDSPDIVRIFAINEQGTQLADFTLTGASQIDWEDITIEGTAGQDFLYVGDIGDNAAARASIVVYRVPEPFVDAQVTTGTAALGSVQAMTLTYPDGARDAETLMFDSQSGDLYIVEKRIATTAGLYRKAAPHTAGASVLTRVATISPGSFAVTAGDISPAGDAILLRMPLGHYLWRRTFGTTIADAFLTTRCAVPVGAEPQGEAVCFSAAGCSYYTLSEGAAQPIYRYDSITYCAAGESWKLYE